MPQADIWSVGVLCWEVVSGRDVTELQPLAMARQLQAAQVGWVVWIAQALCAAAFSFANFFAFCKFFAGLRHRVPPSQLQPRLGQEPDPAAALPAAVQGPQAACADNSLTLPPDAPPLARLIFESCTQMDPALRPNAAQLVEWLRAGA